MRARPLKGLTAGQLAEELIALRQVHDLFELTCAETVRAYDEGVELDEDTHPVGFLRSECR